MIDESPKSYAIRCRRCADSVIIDVPFDVREQIGQAECSRGHVTLYRYDGVTVATEERRWSPRAPFHREPTRPTAGR